jgi:hypothetical protein
MTEPTRDAADPRAAACTLAVSEVFTAILDRVTAWREELVATVKAKPQTRSSLDVIVEAMITPVLSTQNSTAIGAGFVAAPGYLPDAYWHLAWWLSEAAAPLRRLEAVTDPTSDRFRDYTNLEWWRVPERTGLPHITGPYVDYLCTDDYTLTVTMPVYSASTLIGMVGIDSYVKNIESLLLPHLFGTGRAATVVNASGRVVTSSDPHHAPGSILRIAGLSEQLHCWNATGSSESLHSPLPGGESVMECPGTRLALVLGHDLPPARISPTR